jgi:formylglycine-generating enzyme required for sulfatase activity
VRIKKPFYLGQTEVTQAQWRAVLRDNPAFHRGENVPVTGAKWVDAQTFCTSMAHVTGRKVRLPSEAEWEYACRAGTTSAFSFGDDRALLSEYAWAGPDAPRRASDVCGKRPNPWGLCDMHGNVWEWCEDVYHDTYERAPADGSAWTSETDGHGRVLRGGAWFGPIDNSRSAARIRRPVYMRAAYVGLRVVVEAE